MLQSFDLISGLLILTFLANIFLAFFIHYRSSKTPANITFELVIYSIAFWVTAMFFYRLTSLQYSELFARLLYFAASFTAPSFFLFGLFFPRERPNKFLIGITIFCTFFISILCLIPGLIIKDVSIVPGSEKIINFGKAYPFYIVFISGFFTAFYVTLLFKFFKYRNINNLIKVQIQYILIITSIVSVLAMLTNLVLPTLGIFVVNWLGQVLTTFWVGGIAYVIVKHRFIEIRFVVARAIAYIFLLLAIGGIYSILLFLVSSSLFKIAFTQEQIIFYSVITFLVAISFGPLKRMTERATDKYLFKGYYSSEEVLKVLSTIIGSNLDLNRLIFDVLNRVLIELRISKGAIILFEQNNIYHISQIGYDNKVFYKENLNIMLSKTNTVFIEDLEEGDMKQLMRSLNISLFRVLEVKNELVGLLLLGEKSSGEVYSDQDLKVIDILAPEAAVAIQNAKSYDKIKRFNITLTEEVQKATSELQIANTKLQELDRLKDDFVSIASHELRTPMTAIRSYVWMALHKSDVPLSEKLTRYLNRTLISTERLINLVNDMLNISRIESGRIEVLPTAFNMQTLVQDVLAEVEAKAREKALILEVMPTQLPQAFADPDKVHQVLLNLIGNAMKFTPQNGKITISFFSDGNTIETSVKDSGVGITQEDLSRLFKKFGRLDNSYVAAATSGGTGLGLFICKSLIELMGGKIWAKSPGLNLGAVFTFSLPVANERTLAEAAKYTKKVKEGEVKLLEPVNI